MKKNMLNKAAVAFLSCLVVAACASEEPRIIQASPNAKEIHLAGGLATQIELPAGERVQSAVTGNPDLVTVGRSDNIVNIVPSEKVSGDTNLIVRSVDEEGQPKVYQYRLSVQAR